jgi:hypothetical protein
LSDRCHVSTVSAIFLTFRLHYWRFSR